MRNPKYYICSFCGSIPKLINDKLFCPECNLSEHDRNFYYEPPETFEKGYDCDICRDGGCPKCDKTGFFW